MNPSEQRLRGDLASADFEAGVNAGHWRLLDLTWPALTIAISAGTGELVLRIDLDGYPAVAPLGITWDAAANTPLPRGRWPQGPGAEQTYKEGWFPPSPNAVYLACDRAALQVHPDWANTYSDRAWNPTRSVTFYLREIHRDLAAATVPEPEDA